MTWDAKKYCNLAEREGFEPSVPVTQDARLAMSLRCPNTLNLTRPLQTENPCGSVTCGIGAGQDRSHRVSPDLIRSGKFSPPWPHPGVLTPKNSLLPLALVAGRGKDVGYRKSSTVTWWRAGGVGT